MRIRKFNARNMRDAIAKVKQALGPDAVILSARETRRGLFGTPHVEVTAGLDVNVLDGVGSKAGSREASTMSEIEIERIVAPIRAEVRAIRALVKQQSESAGGQAIKSQLTELKSAIGEIREMRANLAEVSSMPSFAEVAQDHVIAEPTSARVIALVGPCGVGKTTTIAKLASRDVLVSGKRVGLITLDTHRVGAVDQIRAYAQLIGVPLEVVRDAAQIREAAECLGDVQRIYVDTGGRSPMDRGAIPSVATAMWQIPELEVHLAISAAESARHIDQIAQRYRTLKPARLVITKVDEAFDLAELVYAPARLTLPVSYITTGQRVPEDLEPATSARLVELATRGPQALAVAA